MNRLYSTVIRYPKLTIALIFGATIYLALQLPQLRWETDARVYLPKGHPAIKYDEKVDEVFGVKDSVIIGIVNEKKGIFNPITLARIARITDKVAALPGVIANRPIDVASLSTATIFVGNESSIGTQSLMPYVPTAEKDIARLKETVFANSDLFVGNLISKDGTATMIRAKLKEGQSNRYMTYWQIQGILAAERGGGGNGQGPWPANGSGQQNWGQGGGQWPAPGNSQGWGQPGKAKDDAAAAKIEQNGDEFYLAGRPVIEVTSGMHAVKDMQVMIPLLLVAIALTLYFVFRTARGVALPLFVMGASIVWTMGVMALANVPLYTISTMLPVILVAVSIGDSVHLLSHYYDSVLEDAHRPSAEIVANVMSRLGLPLLATSVTTGVGFLSLATASMPPFVIFGLFTVLGISFSWLMTVTFIPAFLTLLKPKVGGYLAKRRALRVHSEQGRLTKLLVNGATFLHANRNGAAVVFIIITAVSLIGASRLFADSSWMNDFRKDSELVVGNKMFNAKFSGTIFLNVVIEGNKKDVFKSPDLLRHIEGFQKYVDGLPYVGGSRSIVDYIKNMNKTLHAGDKNYDVIPDSASQIGEYLYLFSISGRPQQLDDMIDYDYRQGLVTFAIKTDHTQALKFIIDNARRYFDKEFAGQGVEAHFAGSANNSYVWADLLIRSQTLSILLSKISILFIAAVLLKSIRLGVITVIPLTMTTLFIAGVAGFLAIPLDVSTALAAGVAIGVGVDYAIHYIFRYREELQRTNDVLAATQATMRSVGRTIVFNALVVSIGFGVLFFSQFPPNVKLGYFVASYMVVSCVMSLIVLPVLFAYSRASPRKQEMAHDT